MGFGSAHRWGSFLVELKLLTEAGPQTSAGWLVGGVCSQLTFFIVLCPWARRLPVPLGLWATGWLWPITLPR